jgi:hypothetical protein
VLFLSDVPPNIRSNRAFFGGKIIDEIHRILRLVRLRRIERGDVETCVLPTLVDKWIQFFVDGIETQLIEHICKQNKCTCTDLFGSRVINLLECILNCRKAITVSVESGGWCYIKGEYTVHRSRFGFTKDRNSGLEPLTHIEQRFLHSYLYNLAKVRNDLHCKQLYADGVNNLSAGDIIRVPVHPYEGLSQCPEICYAYSILRYIEDDQDDCIIFSVDLKCRKELAPIEILLQFRTDPSCDQNGDETAAWTDRVQDSSLHLELKLNIQSQWPITSKGIPLPSDFNCLIQQRNSRLGAPVSVPEEEDMVIPSRSDVRTTGFKSDDLGGQGTGPH